MGRVLAVIAGGWRLTSVDPIFAEYARQFLNQLDHDGIEPIVTEGYRTLERQAQLYAQGRTKPGAIVTNARPGQSAHNYGLALDITTRFGYASVHQRMVHQRAQLWGWGTVRGDLPHIEWPGWGRYV